jgi:hypothetical protein
MRENVRSSFFRVPVFMSCKPPLLPLLLLSILPCTALAERETRCPEATEEARSVQPDAQPDTPPDMRCDAERLEDRRRLKHLWRQLSHEERDALRKQMRANWERMTPEHRQKLFQAYQRHRQFRKNNRRENDARPEEEQLERREARRKAHEAYWQSLDPEERKALRNALRETIRHWRHEETAKIVAEALPETVPPEDADAKPALPNTPDTR